MENEKLTRLLEEGQQFIKLRTAFKREDNPPNGAVGYLISKSWVRKYKAYVQYTALKTRVKPTFENHVKPGPISNADFLETDSSVYLTGTG